MEWLNKFFHHGDHAEWLSRHPDKGEFHLPSGVAVDVAEQQRLREWMEREMVEDARRTKARNEAASAQPLKR